MLLRVLLFSLGLSAAATAFPTLERRQTPGVTPPTSDEFSLEMSVNNIYVSLTAVANGTGDLVLQGGDPSVYPGTPAYVNTSSTSTGHIFSDAIVFDLTSSSAVEPALYGISVPDLGELYGFAINVFAVKGYQEFEFAVDNGTIAHKITSASQNWFACSDIVNNVASTVLKWGVFASDGSFPVGCKPTTVIQRYNVPGTRGITS